MNAFLNDESMESGLERLLWRVRRDEPDAIAEVFLRYRPRLREMIRLRLDRRLQGRIDPSDVLQEAYLEVSRRAAACAAKPEMPFFLWLRMVTGQKLLEIHRRHLQTKMRDATQEISLHGGPFPEADSLSLTQRLVSNLTTPSSAAVRAEQQTQLQEILNAMDPGDREVLALRHFEDLSNGEVATVLGISKSAASNRYVRAIRRLKAKLEQTPDVTR